MLRRALSLLVLLVLAAGGFALWQDAAVSRQRHRNHQARVERLAADNTRLMAPEAPAQALPQAAAAGDAHSEDRKRSAIESALARARAARSRSQSTISRRGTSMLFSIISS